MPTPNYPEERFLCVDPGETTGWSVWSKDKLLGGGQTPLWQFALDVYTTLQQQQLVSSRSYPVDAPLGPGDQTWLHPDIDPALNEGPIGLLIIEKFVLYPWAAKELSFNEFRTVQLIGALTFLATVYDIDLHKQPASIKEEAEKGGAQELFVEPLHENRHQNDSIMHGWFYVRVEVLGAVVAIRDGNV